MTPTLVGFLVLLFGQVSEKGQVRKTLYETLLADGFTVDGARLDFPAPRLREGVSAEAERAALREIAGSDRAAADLTRDSVVAPFVLKTRDEPVGSRGVIRAAGLWFVVRAAIDDIDPGRIVGETKGPVTEEAANMRFTVESIGAGGPDSRRIRITGRMLDKVRVEATNRVEAARSGGSWRIASRTEPASDASPTDPNRWSFVNGKGGEHYPGGASVVTVRRLETVPGALLVEAQFAFFEPKAWFDGAPILRSKIGVVAQDRIRALRRELAKSQKAEGGRSSSGPKGG